MKTQPIIGVTADAEDAGGYSKLPWYALRQNYAAAVARAGGLPLMLPHETALAGAYLDLIDGLVVTGGAFDVDPALFGAADRHATVSLKPGRTDFELAMTRGALSRDMPVLGICGGQQLLHVALGGALYQHVPDEAPSDIAHEQPNPRTEPGHDVLVETDSLLGRIVGSARMSVNSAHHQAAKDCPAGVVVSGRAPDGLIEAIEAPAHRFCLGVQWHPEYEIDPGDARIFQAFVEAARHG
ncbi:MAG: gamma-glutamyl-gamma-aminobutyrate hydrolase family protein [Alphaproteobacteria bacterium]